MRRRLVLVLCLAYFGAAETSVAQPGGGAEASDSPESSQSETKVDDGDHTQDIGVHLGFDVGGRTTPGGLALGGSFIYRLTEDDWLDTGVSFAFGSGGGACFRDRDNSLICDHGLADGFAGDVTLGIRRYLKGSGEFTPYIHGGLAFRFVSFSGDDVQGVAVPLWAGAGVRAKVANRVYVKGGALLRAGLGFLNRGLKTEPHFGLKILGGVEFEL